MDGSAPWEEEEERFARLERLLAEERVRCSEAWREVAEMQDRLEEYGVPPCTPSPPPPPRGERRSGCPRCCELEQLLLADCREAVGGAYGESIDDLRATNAVLGREVAALTEELNAYRRKQPRSKALQTRKDTNSRTGWRGSGSPIGMP